MRLHTLKLPLAGNDGRDYEPAILAFVETVTGIAGGCTLGQVQQGRWRDEIGTLYRNEMVPLEVACSAGEFQRIIAAAFEAFPDQHALFAACWADALVIDRPEVAKAATPGYEGARELSDRLRGVSGVYQKASWALDTALRDVRVAKANGHPTGPAEERLAAVIRTFATLPLPAFPA